MNYRIRPLGGSARIQSHFCWWNPLGLLLMLALASFGQTQIDLQHQSQNIDFSQAPSTKPVKSGSVLPATCGTGELFYKTNAPAGQNVYGCTSTDTWTLQGDGSGSGATAFNQLTDLQLSFSGNTWTIAAGSVAFGDVATSFAAATFSESAPSDSGTIYFCADYNAGSPRLLAVIPAAFNAANYTSNGLTAIAGTGCPVDSLLLGTGTMSSGTGAFGNDARAALSHGPIVRTGMYLTTTATNSGQARQVDIDAGVIPRFFSGSGAPGTISGSRIGTLYWRTDTGQLYLCFQAAADCTAVGVGNWVAIN